MLASTLGSHVAGAFCGRIAPPGLGAKAEPQEKDQCFCTGQLPLLGSQPKAEPQKDVSGQGSSPAGEGDAVSLRHA